MTVEINTVEVVVSNEINHVDIIVDVVVNPNVGGGGGGTGDGDMTKSVYDKNNNGIVDNSEKVNNLTVETAVPINALFTDTIYDDTVIQAEVTANTDKAHTHDNKAVLDTITEEDVINWDAKQDDLGIDPINGDDNKYLNEKGLFNEIVLPASSYKQNLYATNVDSNIPGYKASSYLYEAVSTIKTITCAERNVVTWGEKYLYPLGVDVEAINSGEWEMTIQGFLSQVNGEARAAMRIFKYSVAGVETELFNSLGDIITNTSISTIPVKHIAPNFDLELTDRIGFQIGLICTNNPLKTLTYYVGGGNAMYINVPIVGSHDELRRKNANPNFQHLRIDQINSFLTEIPQDIMNLIYAGL